MRTFEEVGVEYPDITKDHAYVDATCMWMVKNPEWFDVIVTTNMFGDIITDLGAMIQGGMGVAASGNINPKGTSMFEPIHGSAPKYTGQNKANPLASISAIAMLLDHVGAAEAAGARGKGRQRHAGIGQDPGSLGRQVPADKRDRRYGRECGGIGDGSLATDGHG